MRHWQRSRLNTRLDKGQIDCVSMCVCCHGGSICDSFETCKSFLRVGGGVQAGGELLVSRIWCHLLYCTEPKTVDQNIQLLMTLLRLTAV